MFDTLTQKFQNLFTTLSGQRRFTPENIASAIKEVKLALLEADVNYSVVEDFVKNVEEKVNDSIVLKNISPSDHFKKILHDELVELMGSEEKGLNFQSNKLSTIMMIGLQGSGKTSTSAKLANYLKTKNEKKVLLAACDLQRLAAVEQLQKLANEIDCEVFYDHAEKNPIKVAKRAKQHAEKNNFDVLIIDTAGRLHIDDSLMDELNCIKSEISPDEILFVANSTTGQDAANSAKEFDKKLSISGSILTMLDGDARAGSAISISYITKKPLIFEGTGEKISDLQEFNPNSMADRILGMGDIINLVKKAEDNISEKETLEMEKKLSKGSFSFDDYLKQMKMLKKMGFMKSLLKMVPGMPNMSDMEVPEKEMQKTKSIILSMTKKERSEKDILTHGRKLRLAKGSGTSLDDVNKLVKSFKKIKSLFKDMKNLKNLKNLASSNSFDKMFAKKQKKVKRRSTWP
jgi:signal recognition particle subunit SRP54